MTGAWARSEEQGPGDSPIAGRAGARCGVCLLGSPHLLLADGRVHVLERHDAALLALLALEGPTLRARAAALLWPDLSDHKARGNLRQRLFRMQRLAGGHVAGGERALRLGDGIRLDLSEARAALGADPQACAGELLGSHDYSDSEALGAWVGSARSAWRRTRLEALAVEASRFEAERRIAAALPYAQRIVAEDGTLEHGHRRLMRLHYLRGDRAAALAAAHDCSNALQRALGIGPDRETLQLLALIESSGTLPQSAVGTPGRVAAAAPNAATLRPPRLVGRDTEWRRLEGFCRARCVAVVQGEPGIGKTRLLTDFSSSRDAPPVVTARVGDAHLPYALLGRLVRALTQRYGAPHGWACAELARIAPEFGTAATGAWEPRRLEQAVMQTMDVWRGAGLALIALDDIQYADPASLELLPRLSAIGEPGLTWLLGVRAAEIPGVIGIWLRTADPRAVARVSLGALDAAAVEAMLGSLAIPGIDAAAWAPSLTRHTGGNPMYILETLIALLDERTQPLPPEPPALPMPLPVGRLIERRLAQLDAKALKLARVAAIAGQDFSAPLAAAVLGRHVLDIADTWAELEAARVIDDDRFAHDLIREGVLRSVPAPICRALHAEIAAALVDIDTTPAARVAHHWHEARDWVRAAPAWQQAARQAFEASRMGDAGPLFERAADCYERCEMPREQHQALQELAGCRLKQHDLGGAAQVARRLIALATRDEDRAWALDRQCDIANIRRDDADAETAARAMLAAAPESSNGWIAFNATRKLGAALASQGRHAESLALFGSMQGWIDANAHEWNVHVWLCDHASVLDIADCRSEAIAAGHHALHAAREHGNWYVVYAATRNRSFAHFWHGDLQAALRDADSALLFADRLGDANTRDNPRDASRRAVLLRAAGRHAESLALLEVSLGALAAGDSPFWRACCEDQLALGYLAVGQTARAGALLGSEPGCDNAEARATRALARARCLRASTGRPATEALPRALFERPDCPRRWRLLAELERSDAQPAGEARARCADVAAEAQQHELHGIALHARLLAGWAGLRAAASGSGATGARAARSASRARAAHGEAQVRAALAEFDGGTRHPTGLTSAAFAWIGAQSLVLAGDTGGADALLRAAAQRLHDEARAQVPEPFRESFLHRNPVHRDLLYAVARSGR